jgi:hypothetical protein
VQIQQRQLQSLSFSFRFNQFFLLQRNFTSSSVGFLGSTDKERFPIDGRFIITKFYAKLSPDNGYLAKDLLDGKN